METEAATPTRAPPGVKPPGHHRGLVTLLFSDVRGSTVLKQHHEQIRQVLWGFAGEEARERKEI